MRNLLTQYKPLKIALGDLRHDTIGMHSVYVPIGMGYIASYTLSQFPAGSLEMQLFTNPNELLPMIDEWHPDVIGLANYCWNSRLSDLVFRFAKRQKPGCLCIQGGPEFPRLADERKAYLVHRPEIDAYIYGDGEAAFAELVKAFLECGRDLQTLRSRPNAGAVCINPVNGELVLGDFIPRFENMDDIPSPYHNHLMDKWLTGNYIPALETTRGCPYRCAYCFTGNDLPKQYYAFSVQRIKDELSYIADRVKDSPVKQLGIHDSNFGMTERDEEIAEHIAYLIDKYNWPHRINATTGKKNYERILRIAELLKFRIPIGLSQQSLNPDTQKVIMRRNIPVKRLAKIADEVRKRGQTSPCELIIPLPKETKESFFRAQKVLTDANVYSGICYTTMLLKGTLLASRESRTQYQMKTRYRLLPRQFGEYYGEKCFEVEEVCVETNTMPFKDYLDCRGFALIMAIIANEQFDIVRRYIHELKLSLYEYVLRVWELVKASDTCFSQLYSQYLDETCTELFDSEEALYQSLSQPGQYSRLITSEIGDNLLRKYVAKAILIDYSESVDFAYRVLREVAGYKVTADVKDSLEAAMQWAAAIRNIYLLFTNESIIDRVDTLNLQYDVQSWYDNVDDSVQLLEYRVPTTYRISHDKERVTEILSESQALFGEDRLFQLGKIFIFRRVNSLWRDCHRV